jgi:hypothetical protein
LQQNAASAAAPWLLLARSGQHAGVAPIEASSSHGEPGSGMAATVAHLQATSIDDCLELSNLY